MKRCIKTHHVKTFGEIPEGSVWDDDSEYITARNAKYFEDVDDKKHHTGSES